MTKRKGKGFEKGMYSKDSDVDHIKQSNINKIDSYETFGCSTKINE